MKFFCGNHPIADILAQIRRKNKGRFPGIFREGEGFLSP